MLWFVIDLVALRPLFAGVRGASGKLAAVPRFMRQMWRSVAGLAALTSLLGRGDTPVDNQAPFVDLERGLHETLFRYSAEYAYDDGPQNKTDVVDGLDLTPPSSPDDALDDANENDPQYDDDDYDNID